MPDSKNLRDAMNDRGVSQADICRKTGIKSSNMSYICKENRNVSEVTLMKICDALECDPREIALDPKEYESGRRLRSSDS